MKAIKKLVEERTKIDTSELDLSERLVSLNRVTKVVKGGKRLRFRALVVVGDGSGHVGVGLGKAKEVPEAIRKAGVTARKELRKITLSGTTIPHEVLANQGRPRCCLNRQLLEPG